MYGTNRSNEYSYIFVGLSFTRAIASEVVDVKASFLIFTKTRNVCLILIFSLFSERSSASVPT